MAERVKEWLVYEREKKEEQDKKSSKHPRLRRFLGGLKGFCEGMGGGASDVRAMRNSRPIYALRELKEKGFTDSEIMCYPTPDHIPVSKRQTAKDILSKYL